MLPRVPAWFRIRLLCLGLLCFAASLARAGERAVPHPLDGHPGNIFLADEEVSISLPAGSPGSWQLYDYEDHILRSLPVGSTRAELGRLPVGWYEFRCEPEGGIKTNRISLGVLARLATPTPMESPISLDVAMAWFYPPEQMSAAASLVALAGVNWVRDRLSWPELEPERGHFTGPGRYDSSAWAQAKAGLRQLQLTHISPLWANPNTTRFPLNLRDAYEYYRHTAARWKGSIEAFEPWNEPDIEMFGGHTGSEIATLQKAACFGLRAGNPRVIVCNSVFALHPAPILDDFRDNQAWAYFDTFNLHHYEPFDQYPQLYADFRRVSSGKPLWVTECAVPVEWSGDPILKEPSDVDLRRQAERVARVYACSLHEGAAETFYFLLPHFSEGRIQFGIVRTNLTPRPAYLALAAVGRLLADARPLGRLRSGDSRVRAFAFRAEPDGKPRTMVVAWVTDGSGTIALPGQPLAVFDHLGRPLVINSNVATLHTGPIFLMLPKGASESMALQPPPVAPPILTGKPCPVVIQAIVPSDREVLARSAYKLGSEAPSRIPLRIYNFSGRRARGALSVQAPGGWRTACQSQIDLAADQDAEVVLSLDPGVAAAAEGPQQIHVQGDFGKLGRSILSFRVLMESRALR